MSRAAQRNPSQLSPESALNVRRGKAEQGGVLHLRAIAPTRFGGVGVWRVRSHSIVLSGSAACNRHSRQ